MSGSRTNRLLTRIWKIFDLRLVLPENSHCKILIKKWPMGALTNAPYTAIFGTRELK